MKKIVDLLEAYVEYLVLGIGIIFLLMMVYAYLFPPGYVTKEVSISGEKKVVTPGDVDEQILSGPANTLDNLIASGHLDPPPVGSFVDAFAKGVANPTNTPPMALADNLLNDQPVHVAPPKGIGGGGPGWVRPNPANTGPLVAALPVPPAAQIVVSYAGQTTVNPAAMPKAAANAPTRKDIRWVTSVAIIPKSIADKWNDSFGPAKPGGPPRWANATTQILLVKVQRSEKSIDGQWSQEQDVNHFEFTTLLPTPKPNDLNEQRRFINWAAHNIQSIAVPDFVKRADGLAGTIWKEPNVILQSLIKAPAAPKSAEISPPEDFDLRIIPTQFRGGGGPGPGPGGGGGPGGPGGPPAGLGRFQQQPPRTPPKTVSPTVKTPPAGAHESLEPVVSADKNYHPASMPSEPPNALFNPTVNPADMMFDFHDDTVLAGHTYRYRTQYTLLNPVFDQAGAVANKKLAEQYGLDSDKSDWGPEITVPPSSYFYCAKNFSGNDKNFAFDVFAWSDGKWHKHTFAVNPGDSIGQMAKDGDANIDFSTKFSYVESAFGINDRSIVTVVSDQGSVEIRDCKKEMDSDDHRAKQAWVDNPTQGNEPPPSVAATPGGPPGMGGAPGTPPGMFHPPGAPAGVFVPMPTGDDNGN